MFNDLVYLRRLWSHDKTLDSLKVALAFAGVVGFCFGTNHDDWLIGLILGIALVNMPFNNIRKDH